MKALLNKGGEGIGLISAYANSLAFRVKATVAASDSRREERGQGMVEYALIVSLIGVAVCGILLVVGKQVGHVFSTVNTKL